MQYIETKIPVFFFPDGTKVVAYSPAFDISTYGENAAEAKRRFGEAVAIFLKECAQMGTLEEVLDECGWRKPSQNPAKCSCEEELIKIPMPA
jgi:hypothetical protein